MVGHLDCVITPFQFKAQHQKKSSPFSTQSLYQNEPLAVFESPQPLFINSFFYAKVPVCFFDCIPGKKLLMFRNPDSPHNIVQ